MGRFIIAYLILLNFSSCHTPNSAIETKVCVVHQKRMHKKFVINRYGIAPIHDPIIDSLPNANYPIPRGCVRHRRDRYQRHFVCAVCEKQYNIILEMDK